MSIFAPPTFKNRGNGAKKCKGQVLSKQMFSVVDETKVVMKCQIIKSEPGKHLLDVFGQFSQIKSSMYFDKLTQHHYIFIISQLWLTSHPRTTVVLLDT